MVVWDVTPPKDREAEGRAMQSFAQGVTALRSALAAYGRDVDIESLLSSHGIPTIALGSTSGLTASSNTGPTEDANRADSEIDPDGDGLPGEPPSDTSAQELADKMTEAGIERCEHGARNRCRLCGIERVRDFEVGDDGEIEWKVIWRPIVREEQAA